MITIDNGELKIQLWSDVWAIKSSYSFSEAFCYASFLGAGCLRDKH